MKINKSQLKKLIKEEAEKILQNIKENSAPAPTREKEKTKEKEPKKPGMPSHNPKTVPLPAKAEYYEENSANAPTREKEKTKEKEKSPKKPGMPSHNPKTVPLPAKAKYLEEKQKFMKEYSALAENIRMRELINEAPLRPDGEDGRYINPNIKQGIEGQSGTPFSDIEFLQRRGESGDSTLEKLGSEEFNDAAAKSREVGRLDPMATGRRFMELSALERPHYDRLEALALDTVQQAFGLSDEVMEKIEATLKPFGSGGMDMDDDSGDSNDIDDVLDDFNDEEKELIKQHVDKRIIQNALMMGAGFRSHNTLRKIKDKLDAIDPNLFPAYNQVMPNAEFWTWAFSPNEVGNRMVLGKSELKFKQQEESEEEGEEEDKEKVREVEGGKAVAYNFPVLLHEIAKVAMELFFAYSLENLDPKIQKAVIDTSDSYTEEHWMKLIGPRLWKYLHDAIDYIVHDREDDYTIVSTLLFELGTLEPLEFKQLIDDLIHNGPVGLRKLENMLDQIRRDIEAYEEYHNRTPEPEEIVDGDDNTEEISKLMKQLEDELISGETDIENEDDITKLNDALQKALEDEDYEMAAKLRDKISKHKG
jgi:hypothetical protein